MQKSVKTIQPLFIIHSVIVSVSWLLKRIEKMSSWKHNAKEILVREWQLTDSNWSMEMIKPRN